MPADSYHYAVCIGMYVVWVCGFVGKKVDVLPAVLVRRLNDHIRSAVSHCRRDILSIARMDEIRILAVEIRV